MMIYSINFHYGRRVFNRYFSTKEKAMNFAATLWDDPKVDISKGIYLMQEPVDKEEIFVAPQDGKDPQPYFERIQKW